MKRPFLRVIDSFTVEGRTGSLVIPSWVPRGMSSHGERPFDIRLFRKGSMELELFFLPNLSVFFLFSVLFL